MNRRSRSMQNDRSLCVTARYWRIVVLKFKRVKIALLALLMLPQVSGAMDQDLLFTGEVFSRQAQEVFVPLTNNWQARISMMVPEGTQVQVGDRVVEFDGSEAARQLEQQLENQRT